MIYPVIFVLLSENPYKTTLTCLDTFQPSNVWDEGGNSNGDILLLANHARDRFYCAVSVFVFVFRASLQYFNLTTLTV